MKKILLSAAFLTSSLCFGFSQSTFTLLSAITESLNSNYDIKKQQNAVANAESQLRQIKGNLDFEIGAVEAAKKKISISKADALPDAKLKLNIGATGSKYSDDFDDTLDSPFWNIKGVNWGGSVSVAIKPGNNTKRGVIDQNYTEYNTALNEYNKVLADYMGGVLQYKYLTAEMIDVTVDQQFSGV